jgi:glycosyltransferase involved in cell wall biosynthesis
MIRYEADFGREYFVEYFRKSQKFQGRTLPAPNHADRQRFISVCTTCMNRLDDIMQTLPQNLEDNTYYGPAEFILLDYGSSDGLGDWVKASLPRYIESGRLAYYRTEQDRFRPNHSRNVTFRLARGEVVVNVDADNFTHFGFLDRLNQCASAASSRLLMVPQSFLAPDIDRFYLRGRFAVYREDLTSLGGFDESLDNSYSHDDVSFVLRAVLSGFNTVRFEDRFVADRLETPLPLRTAMFANKNLYRGKLLNERITKQKLSRCELMANKRIAWGATDLVKNFSEIVRTARSD